MSATTYANRHDREEHHIGTMWSTLVGISSALGTDIPGDMTLEEAIAVIDARISRLENTDIGFGSFLLDAYLMSRNFLADALIQKTVSGSFTSSSVLLKTVLGSLTADAELSTSGTFTQYLDAMAVVQKTIVAQGIAPYVYSTAGSGGLAGTWSWTHSVNSTVKSMVVVVGRGGVNSDAMTSLSYGNLPLTRIEESTGLNPYLAHVGIWFLDDISGRDDDVIRGVSSATVYAKSIAVSADVPLEILSSGSYPGSSLNNVNMTTTAGEAGRESLAFPLGWINKSSDANLQSLSGAVNRWVQTVGSSTFKADSEYINGTHAVGFYVSGPNYVCMVELTLAPPRLRFFVDADVLRAMPGSLTLDSIVKAMMPSSFTSDAVTQVTQSGSFDVSSFVQPYFLADAVISLSGTPTFTFELPADSVVMRTAIGQLLSDAIVQTTPSPTFTTDSIVKKAMPQSVAGDAVIKRTMSEGSMPTYSSVAGGTSGRSGTWSWTHTIASGVRSLVVVAGRGGSNSDAISALSYGNKTMTKIAESTGSSPYLAHVGIWYLSDTNGRDDDVVRGTSSATIYANSIAITADGETTAISTGSAAGASRNNVNMAVTAGVSAMKALGITDGWINKSTGDNLQSLSGQVNRWAQATGSNYFKADTEPILGTHAIGYYISGSNYCCLAAVAIGQPFKFTADAVIAAA